MPDGPPSLTELVTELGGVATRSELRAVLTRRQIETLVDAGQLVRVGHGHYALPSVDDDLRVAAEVGGVLALTSAALRHGWAVKKVPDRPDVMVGRGRRLLSPVRSATIHRGQLTPSDVSQGVTREAVTLAHCLRRLPFDEALCVADSALRAGFPRRELLAITDSARGPGSAQMVRVGRAASPQAANVFESVLRAIALDVEGLVPQPQVEIRGDGYRVRPDLVDVRLRIVIEADSFEWHGGRAALSADARRYDLLVADGWIVLRFSYEHVMTQPEFVTRILTAVVVLAQRMRQAGILDGRAA